MDKWITESFRKLNVLDIAVVTMKWVWSVVSVVSVLGGCIVCCLTGLIESKIDIERVNRIESNVIVWETGESPILYNVRGRLS